MLILIQENESLLLILGVVSVVCFLLTLALIPWVLLRIPSSYFARPTRVSLLPRDAHPFLRFAFLIVKNLFGIAIIAIGIAMLILPGQGLLTILIGVMLIDFPRKYRFQRWLISLGPVLKSANWLRKKGGREPLEIN